MKNVDNKFSARLSAMHKALLDHHSAAQAYLKAFNASEMPVNLICDAEEVVRHANRLLAATRSAADFIADHYEEIRTQEASGPN